MKKPSIYNRFNVFGTLLLSTLLPCFLATLFLAVVFVPMMTTTASGNDSAYEQNLLYSAASQFEDLCETVDETVAVVEHNTWIRTLYVDVVNGKSASSTLKESIAAELNQACIRGEVKSLSFRFYNDMVLYNNRGVVENPERSRESSDQYSHYLHYYFFASQEQEQIYSTINFDGVDYLLYQTPFRDIDGGRYKGEINILFQSSVLGARLLQAVGPHAAAFRMTSLKTFLL